MGVDRDVFPERFLSSSLGRCLAEPLFRYSLRRRLTHLEQTDPATAQHRILRGLVQRAQRTRFGLAHDFARIRTPADFQRLVPLRTRSQLWQEYGGASLPQLEGVTWPGPIYYLATCEVESGQPIIPTAISSDLMASHRRALMTALALVGAARPQARLLSGTILLVGGGTALTAVRGHSYDSMEHMARRQLPALLRAVTVVAPQSGTTSLQALAEHTSDQPVTILAGNARRLVDLARLLRQRTQRDTLGEVWPTLTAVLYSRGPHDPDRAQLQALLGLPQREQPVLLLETVVRPEGVLAIEDPRQRLLRLLPDLGHFYEFIPVEQLSRPNPERLTLAEVVPGVSYAMALSSPAGLWASLLGVSVCFESVAPPVLRALEQGVPMAPSPMILPLYARNETVARLTPARHRQNAGTPGEPARKLARSPWSAHADQR